jgi:hypothetical protein
MLYCNGLVKAQDSDNKLELLSWNKTDYIVARSLSKLLTTFVGTTNIDPLFRAAHSR